ncbi:SDR family oxidoreductase [Martelella lutilitoris]|uniref:SDR family oxidoreductase n=1 Tax=Martelella lutilitoris TaxID=2583532 RepID=A0A5C4JS35_9HYPH|nr:SDR family oxidoreductase [Martelella lutilitoris]TNB48285.1 SDR family oxidoreductase [Martelella lutilitoris]
MAGEAKSGEARQTGNALAKTVLVAGATGYLGRHLVAAFHKSGYRVIALVRDGNRAARLLPEADQLIEAEATEAESLSGIMNNVDIVISALGITRQKDGLTYHDVDYGANCNLLAEAERAGVSRFAYVHVFKGDQFADESALARAKQDFVDRLEESALPSTVIAPTGYFSDMGDVFNMAARGRVFLFGDGQVRVNPIAGADLAAASVDAIENGTAHVDIGGPDVFTFDDIGRLAFAALGKPPRFLHLPQFIADGLLFILKRITGPATWGPFEFFLVVSRRDMAAPCYGTQTLQAHFEELAQDRTNNRG